MGSRTHDFLSESFLFLDELISEQFASIPESELYAELQRYREFCFSNEQELLSEVRANPSNLKIFSGLAHVTVDQLKQSALYAHQYVINDPLISLVVPQSEISVTMNRYLGFGERSIDKNDVAAAMRFLKVINPMVAAGFVKLLPISNLFEPPKEIPILHSDNYFDDVLPPALLAKFRERAVVRSMEKTEQGWKATDVPFLSRAILIEFQDHLDGAAYPYCYLDLKARIMNE